jgi:hypothetical protein
MIALQISLVFFAGFIAGCGWGYSAGLQKHIEKGGNNGKE